ncbi:MAG: hypothetical protein HC895_26605 [Leptolyngbyaceae cyanobacterium SM1_3_5]|nr:hypothetical protein [Leptolyngbyaceae cyanobacterium SM1_3_5]
MATFAGCELKIQQTSDACRKEIISEAQSYWLEKFENLKKQVFIDEKDQLRNAVGWSDKEKLIKEISPLLKDFSRKLDRLIDDDLAKVLRQLKAISLNEIKSFMNLLNSEPATELLSELITTRYKVEDLLTQKISATAKGETYLPSIADIFHPYIDAWKKRFGDIAWNEVSEFSFDVLQRSEKRVNTMIDDRMLVVNDSFTSAIAFYIYFLETHARYTAETPEQKLAEKAWIDQQRQKLQQLQTQLNLLNS